MDYETFIAYVNMYPKSTFTRKELTMHIKNITPMLFNKWLVRACGEGKLIRSKGILPGYHANTYVYRIMGPNEKRKIIIHNIYELHILKALHNAGGFMEWHDLKKDLIDTYGTISGNRKLVRAINNLYLKHYVLIEESVYSLNPAFDFSNMPAKLLQGKAKKERRSIL